MSGQMVAGIGGYTWVGAPRLFLGGVIVTYNGRRGNYEN